MQAVATTTTTTTTATTATAAAPDRLSRVSRMRTLSALLESDDGGASDEAPLPAELLAVFAQRDARAAAAKEAAAASSSPDLECVECRAHASEVFCEQCHDYFCELCFGGQHRKGNRQKHTFQPRLATAAGGESSATAATAAAGGDERLVSDDDDEDEDDDDDDDSSEVRSCALEKGPLIDHCAGQLTC